MAMATPVITTSQTLKALQTKTGQDIVVADTPPAIAQTVINLLTDDTLRQRIGQAGRRYVETHHDWKVTTKKLEAIYREAMALHNK